MRVPCIVGVEGYTIQSPAPHFGLVYHPFSTIAGGKTEMIRLFLLEAISNLQLQDSTYRNSQIRSLSIVQHQTPHLDALPRYIFTMPRILKRRMQRPPRNPFI